MARCTVLLDGQFGSTGKGLMAAWMANNGFNFDLVTTNAGPNSGHTFYDKYGEKIVLKQLPTYAVATWRNRDRIVPVWINGGAVVNRGLLNREITRWLTGHCKVMVSPYAAIINPYHESLDSSTVHRIASTGQGVGPALAEKVLRGENSVIKEYETGDKFTLNSMLSGPMDHYSKILVETAQGFSLGINQGFYPCTTSRECSVQQALADANIPSYSLSRVIGCFRTFPIRVGSTDNSSGGWYPDQTEVMWEDIGVEPERTTVTGRVRRIATWSDIQFEYFLKINRPDILFFNFMNYLPEGVRSDWLHDRIVKYQNVMGARPMMIFLGFGPKTEDIMRFFP